MYNTYTLTDKTHDIQTHYTAIIRQPIECVSPVYNFNMENLFN